MQWTICCLVYFICGDSSSEYTSILQIRKKVSADVTLFCASHHVFSAVSKCSFITNMSSMFSSETEQRGMRGIWHGGSFKIQHIKCKMKWGVGMRGGVKLTVRCSATLWAQMAPALLWGKQFHPHWGHSSSEQMQLFYCNVLWTEITGECHLAGKQDELDGVMLFGWIYWLCSHGLQNHIFTVLLNTNLVWCYVRWRKAGQEENIWSLITGCDLFSCPLQNFHCFLTMAQAFILLNKHLNLTY